MDQVNEDGTVKLPEGLVIPDAPLGISSVSLTAAKSSSFTSNNDEVHLVVDESPEAIEARKPKISHLEDATVVAGDEVLPLFGIGDRIVIERYAHSLMSTPWLDTQTYLVDDIDDETGDLKLWNADLMQHAMGNFRTGPARGDVYKLFPKEKGSLAIGKRKRGRPKKDRSAETPKSTPTAANSSSAPANLAPGQKRKRGRPAGSKNRPKAEIAAERLAKRALRTPIVRGAKLMLQLWYSLLLQQILWIPNRRGSSVKWISRYLLEGIERVVEPEVPVPYLGGPRALSTEKYVLVRKEGSVMLVALPDGDRVIFQLPLRRTTPVKTTQMRTAKENL